MFKKIAALGGAGALLLALVSPAAACRGRFCLFTDETTTTNESTVIVTAVSDAYTGGNSIKSEAEVERSLGARADVGSGGETRIQTGNATAESEIRVRANTSDCGCPEDGNDNLCDCLTCSRDERVNTATVDVMTDAYAYTGENEVEDESEVEESMLARSTNWHDGSRIIETGDARTSNLVNIRVNGLR